MYLVTEADVLTHSREVLPVFQPWPVKLSEYFERGFEPNRVPNRERK